MQENLPALFATLLLLTAVPGPSDFAVVSRSMTRGFKQGLVMIAGIVAADGILILAALFSLVSMIELFGDFGAVLNYACGAILLWMGIATLRAQPTDTQEPAEAKTSSSSSSFMTGLLITLGDPKALLFYFALFPAYVDVAEVGLADALIVLALATLAITSVKGLYAWLAARAFKLLGNRKLQRILNTAAGLLLIGVAIYMIYRGTIAA